MKEIPLTKGAVAIVDDEDYEELSQYKWQLHNKGYAFQTERDREGVQKAIMMHRSILGLEHGDPRQGDHRDGSRLNNRRLNLRIATRLQNSANRRLNSTSTSGFKGVCFDKRAGKWKAAISVNRKKIYLGLYQNTSDAHVAYKTAAVKYFGEFSNF